MKKKILFLIPSLEIGGGAEKIASLLSIKLSIRYKISIITFYDKKDLYPFKGKYFSLKLKVKFWRKIFMSIKIYKLIKFFSPNLIISFMDHTNSLAVVLKFLFRFKIPLVICVHTNPKMAYKKKDRYLNILIRLLYPSKLVDKVITISRDVEKILECEYSIKRSKLKTIYNAVDFEEIKEKKKETICKFNKLFDKSNIIKFITIGSLREVKGHKYLIDAFSSVKEQVPNSKLIIIGEGPLKHELEKKIKDLNLVDDILLLGLQKNPYKYLAKSDIFVFSSLREGFPTVLLEALACGLPIISTDCETGPREILDNGKYGLLVEVKNRVELYKKMVLLAKNDNLIKKLSKLSLERAKWFNLNNITDIWITLIEKVIRNKK